MYDAAASCKDIARTPVTTCEPQCVTLAGYGYAVRHGVKVQLVTPCRVSHFQRYGVKIRGNVTSVGPPKVCVGGYVEDQVQVEDITILTFQIRTVKMRIGYKYNRI